MVGSSLVGRDTELAAIEKFMAAATNGVPGALVLSGEPGIGKTVLWEAGVERAAAAGHRVLVHRSVRSEAGLSFAGLTDLVAPVLDEVADALSPPRRRSLEVALLLADPAEARAEPRAIGLAALDVLRTLAHRGAVVVALDDLQWLDASSAQVLAIALRRLRSERVGVLATLRQAPDSRAAFSLSESFVDSRLHTLPLGPLDATALHRLLRERHPLKLSRREVIRIDEISSGNPFFALELARSVERTEPGQGIAVPESLRELLGARLAGLPQATRDVLFEAAALARPTLELIAAARDGSDAAVDALHAAAAADVVVLSGSRVRFSHPLLAALCYEQAPPSRRRAVHRRLARAVHDPEERARHRALGAGGPHATLAAELEAAAQLAAARGATAAAAELAELAAAHTPQAMAAEQRRRRLAAAGFQRFSGDVERARASYEALLPQTRRGVERAAVLYALASMTKELPTTIRLCDDALKEAAGDDASCAEILGLRGIIRWGSGHVPAGLRDARAGLAKAERAGDGRLIAIARARTAMIESYALEFTPGLLEHALASERALDRAAPWHENPTLLLAVALVHCADEPHRVRSMLEEVEMAAIDRGDEETRPMALFALLVLEWHTGRWQRALELAAIARELGEQSGAHSLRENVERAAARVEADLGLVEQARGSAEEGLRLAQVNSTERMIIGNRAALGQIELALGNHDRAADYLRELPARVLASGHLNPMNGPWADTIETLIALGELDRARTHLGRFEELARKSNRWARIGATRCAGLLAAAEGDSNAALTAFQRALEEDEPPTYPLERGRTLLALGSILRQARKRRAAREALEQSRAVFEELGARLWAEKARDELRRISGRRPGGEGLTEAEFRVAALAAEGRHNSEIAAALFLTVRTVESNLTRVYRKLGVRSRTELSRRFSAEHSMTTTVETPPTNTR
jgi:DNA-binding CsgD family transcriptional regulator/Cdc6-like AAA superfamily ATPase